MVLAGLADFKNELAETDMLDQRLSSKIIQVIDVSYGGDNGFNQAIELAAESLSNVKFLTEKKLVSSFFQSIAQDTGKFCFGIRDTMIALEAGAVQTLILWENFEGVRELYQNAATGQSESRYYAKADVRQPPVDENGTELEMVQSDDLLEWFTMEYKRFGTTLEIITNRSQEGSQFCRGFGGIGGLLRYKMDFTEMENAEVDMEEDLEDYF